VQPDLLAGQVLIHGANGNSKALKALSNEWHLRNLKNSEMTYAFAGTLSGAPRTYSIRRDDSDFVVFCFAQSDPSSHIAARRGVCGTTAGLTEPAGGTSNESGCRPPY
jgi:hypothetical protein